MKKIYSVAAKIVRWMVVGIVSFIAAIPAIVSLLAYAQAPIDRSIDVSHGELSPAQPKYLLPAILSSHQIHQTVTIDTYYPVRRNLAALMKPHQYWTNARSCCV